MTDKKQKKQFHYRYLTCIAFAVVIFVLFFTNMGELYAHLKDNTTEHSPKALVSDAEAIESAAYPFINLNGLYQGIMQRNYMYDVDEDNELIRSREGSLVSAGGTYDRGAVRASADALKETSDYLAANGIPMLYVQAGSKMTLSPEESMIGIKNYSYDKVETFMADLRERNIDCIDTREITDNGMEAFYKTDHHWTTDTCMKVSENICSRLSKEYGLNLDEKLFAADAFDREVHENAFLGAEGRRTGIYYVGLDDFNVFKPKYDTDFNVDISSNEDGKYSRSGSYENSIMDSGKDPGHYSFDDSAYYIYWGGDFSYVHVDNNRQPDGKSLLIIKDSYGIPVSAFMAGAFRSMDIVDMRYYSEDISVKQLIDNNRPDAVVYVYGSGYLDRSSMFTIK